jgi:hypothetical protein
MQARVSEDNSPHSSWNAISCTIALTVKIFTLSEPAAMRIAAPSNGFHSPVQGMPIARFHSLPNGTFEEEIQEREKSSFSYSCGCELVVVSYGCSGFRAGGRRKRRRWCRSGRRAGGRPGSGRAGFCRPDAGAGEPRQHAGARQLDQQRPNRPEFAAEHERQRQWNDEQSARLVHRSVEPFEPHGSGRLELAFLLTVGGTPAPGASHDLGERVRPGHSLI